MCFDARWYMILSVLSGSLGVGVLVDAIMLMGGCLDV